MDPPPSCSTASTRTFSGPTQLRQRLAFEQLDDVKGLVWETLRSCCDPEIPVNIVELGLIYVCDVIPIDDERAMVSIKMTLTAPGCAWVTRSPTRSRGQRRDGVRPAVDALSHVGGGPAHARALMGAARPTRESRDSLQPAQPPPEQHELLLALDAAASFVAVRLMLTRHVLGPDST